MPKNKFIVFVGIGIESVALILSAVWLGQHIDSYLKIRYVFTSVLPIVALVAWIIHVIYMVKKINE